MDIFQKCYEFTKPDELRAAGLYPYFHALESRQDTEVIMEGKRRIMLGSNNYLGLTSQPEVAEAGIKAIEQYGTGCSGSRFLNGTLVAHLSLEEKLAKFLNKEACVTLSTGFQTNLGVISSIVGHGDYAICDREDHASIYDGTKLSYGQRLRYHHSRVDELESLLKKIPEEAGKLIITDGVFSMRGDICPLPDIVDLAKKYGARVMVDDAHGLGVIGEGGRGTASYFGLEKEVDLIMGTFSKSLASLGGYCVGDYKIIDFIKNTSRPFMFAASITPASCATANAALDYLIAHPERVERLAQLSNYMRNGLKERKVKTIDSTTPIIPVYTYDFDNTFRISMRLFEEGVYANSVQPPATDPGQSLIRFSLMATHTEALLDEAMDIIAKVMGEFNLLEG